MPDANKKFFSNEFKEKATVAAHTGIVFAIAITPIILVSALINRAFSK